MGKKYVSGYKGQFVPPLYYYVVSLSTTLYFIRIVSVDQRVPDGDTPVMCACSVSPPGKIALKVNAFLMHHCNFNCPFKVAFLLHISPMH